KADVRAVTRSPSTLARAVMSSSDIPSLNGSLFGSAPMLTNGSTAMERAGSPDEPGRRVRRTYPATSAATPAATNTAGRAACLVNDGGAPVCVSASRKAEIRDDRLPAGEQDVLWLDVPVHHIVAVGIAQGARHLPGNPHGFLDGQLRFAVQPVPQRFALQVGHHIVEKPVGLAGVVQGEDMGMGEAGRDLDLTEEALGPESGRQLGPEHLDGHGAAVFQVLSQVHRCHAAVAEL